MSNSLYRPGTPLSYIEEDVSRLPDMPASSFATPEGKTRSGKARKPSRRYKGYVVIPHAVPGEEDQAGDRFWSLGVFLRTSKQPAKQSRYFRFRGVQAHTKEAALKQALQLGKRLVDEELLPFVQRTTKATLTEVYRRIPGQIWHFCRTCSFWPVEQYEESSRAPKQDQICNECLTRASTGTC